METKEIIRHAQELIKAASAVSRNDPGKARGLKARVCEFLMLFGGKRNSFVVQVEELSYAPDYEANIIKDVLEAFIAHLEAGLVGGISPKRQAELDVVSDFLSQAHSLLESPKVHPAAPAVLIGATLEEFLRTWIDEAGLVMGQKSNGLDNYAKVLREAELISKQDVKDITSWAGIRNHAAHGEWAELGDKQRVRIMFDGVNLFMRTYGAR